MNEVKVGTFPIQASYTCNFISKLLQGGQKKKNGGFLLNCTNIPLIVLCWKSRLLVDFKIRISNCKPRERKYDFMYTAYEEMGANTFNCR